MRSHQHIPSLLTGQALKKVSQIFAIKLLIFPEDILQLAHKAGSSRCLHKDGRLFKAPQLQTTRTPMISNQLVYARLKERKNNATTQHATLRIRLIDGFYCSCCCPYLKSKCVRYPLPLCFSTEDYALGTVEHNDLECAILERKTGLEPGMCRIHAS